jgi:hypothetical protein
MVALLLVTQSYVEGNAVVDLHCSMQLGCAIARKIPFCGLASAERVLKVTECVGFGVLALCAVGMLAVAAKAGCLVPEKLFQVNR